MNTVTFEARMERVTAGEPLPAAEIAELAATPDILPLGMLADSLRRRLHGTQVTYLRVAGCAHDRSFADAVPPAAREVRVIGAPDSLPLATAAVASARTAAGGRIVSGFSWLDVARWSGDAGATIAGVLAELRSAGLDVLAELPLDRMESPADVLDQLTTAGFQRLRLTIDKAPAGDRVRYLLLAAALQDQFACVQTLNPLPASLNPMRPTTGYDDVKMVAIARLAAPNIPVTQVDWLRYGPKLAQVALTFGADDLDNVSASDEAPEGRRRAPLEDVRRNIEAAGFTAVERDGRFTLL